MYSCPILPLTRLCFSQVAIATVSNMLYVYKVSNHQLMASHPRVANSVLFPHTLYTMNFHLAVDKRYIRVDKRHIRVLHAWCLANGRVHGHNCLDQGLDVVNARWA